MSGIHAQSGGLEGMNWTLCNTIAETPCSENSIATEPCLLSRQQVRRQTLLQKVHYIPAPCLLRRSTSPLGREFGGFLCPWGRIDRTIRSRLQQQILSINPTSHTPHDPNKDSTKLSIPHQGTVALIARRNGDERWKSESP